MIERIDRTYAYQGLLADLAELTDTSEYPAGSTYHAIDTGDDFVKYAGGWLLDLRRAKAIKRAIML